MYRGLSDYLGRTNYFQSNRAITPGALPSNGTPFGNFIARPGPGNASGLGNMQSDCESESSVQIIGSLTLTVASSNDEGEEKDPSLGDENV